jgi:hypothetical protein
VARAGSGYAGWALTSSRTPAATSAVRLPSSSRMAVPISEAIDFMSLSVMPWVVTAGLPTRMPDAMEAGCGS